MTTLPMIMRPTALKKLRVAPCSASLPTMKAATMNPMM
jgi:hypothetical protein